MLRPHDTERILETLGKAIEELRQEARRIERDEFFDYSLHDEVANDLALLHGAVSVERDRFDVETFQAISQQPDTPQRRAHIRAVKTEEIQDEVIRGEHRDD